MWVAIASVGLMYVLAAGVFASVGFGILAGGVLAVMPLLWRQSQNAPALLYPLPFVLGWLIAVDRFRTRSLWGAVVGGGVVGIGTYTTNSAIVMMPLYVVLTIAIVALTRTAPTRVLAVFVGAFCVAITPLALWVITHPEWFRQLVNSHRFYDANRFNVLQGLREMTSWVGLTARSDVYYRYFNPTFLFTGYVLPLPLVILLPAGVLRILTYETTPLAHLSLAGFLTAPFAACLTAEDPIEARIVYILPFVPLVSVYGLQYFSQIVRSLIPAQDHRSRIA